MKVSVIGAGNVGATCAEYIALNRIASEVVILDIKENFAIYFENQSITSQ